MSDYPARLADATAAHYAALRDRRVPAPVAALMAWRFHRALIDAILFDDAFEPAIGRMLAPADVEKAGRHEPPATAGGL